MGQNLEQAQMYEHDDLDSENASFISFVKMCETLNKNLSFQKGLKWKQNKSLGVLEHCMVGNIIWGFAYCQEDSGVAATPLGAQPPSGESESPRPALIPFSTLGGPV